MNTPLPQALHIGNLLLKDDCHQAAESLLTATKDLLWLAEDIGNGEFECGQDHAEREIEAFDAAVRAVYALAGRKVSRANRAADLYGLRAAFAERIAINRSEFGGEDA